MWYLGDINLKDTNLKSIYLTDVDLEGANFKFVDLRFKHHTSRVPGYETAVRQCDFEGADVTGTLYSAHTNFGWKKTAIEDMKLNTDVMVLTTSPGERDLDATQYTKQFKIKF